MLKFCEPGQSKARDRRLSTYITKGEEIVTHCTDLIAEASKSFDSWRALTKALYRALQDALGTSILSIPDNLHYIVLKQKFIMYRPKAKAGTGCEERDRE